MEVKYKDVAWLNLAQNLNQWRALVKTAVMFPVLDAEGNPLKDWKNFHFSTT
jgi:hypothetical protein